MRTITLHLEDQVFQQIQQLALARQITLGGLLTTFIEQLVQHQNKPDVLLGLFAEEPELIDTILTEIMLTRETQPILCN